MNKTEVILEQLAELEQCCSELDDDLVLQVRVEAIIARIRAALDLDIEPESQRTDNPNDN